MFKIDLTEGTPNIDTHYNQYLNAPLTELKPEFVGEKNLYFSNKDKELMTKMFLRTKDILYG